MPTAIVTGGFGFLGRHVVQRLIAEGMRVVVFDDQSTPGTSPNPQMACDICAGDLTAWSSEDPWDPWNITDLREVWHLASPASPPLYKARRTTTLRLGGQVLDRLLATADSQGARLLFASSSEVYGDPEFHVQLEWMPSRIQPVGPRSSYDASKVYGEAMCAAWHHETGVQAKIARIFNTFGTGQVPGDGRLMPALIGAAVHGTPFTIHGTGAQERTFGYVDDTVDGLFRIMRDGQPATPYNVGGTDTRNINHLVDDVRRLVGPVTTTHAARQDVDDPMRRCPNTDKLRELGWSPKVGLDEGIRRTAEWIRVNT